MTPETLREWAGTYPVLPSDEYIVIERTKLRAAADAWQDDLDNWRADYDGVWDLYDATEVCIEAFRKRLEAAEKAWWHRMSRGDIAAELSATFDLGLPVCVAIADWILGPAALAGEEP